MHDLNRLYWKLAGIVFASASLLAVAAENPPALLQQGSTFTLGSKEGTLTRLEALPRVESEYSKRFQFDSHSNPKLEQLRHQYRLDDVIAPGKDEFDRQVHLMDWTHRQFKKFGRPTSNARGALAILEGIQNGETYFCAQYAKVFVSAAASLGWVDRLLALRQHQDLGRSGSSEHSTTEIWSNQYAKWIMLDPTSNSYLEKNGVPLNAVEIRQEWFYNEGRDLVFVIGKERQRYKRSDLPIVLAHFADFGELAIGTHELDKYGFIGYIPNTNLMDASEDYAQMFIVKDELCAGTRWHLRKLPANPTVDPYFPIGQAAMALELEPGGIRVRLSTLTPNLKRFEVRTDDGPWTAREESFVWTLHPGDNKLEASTLNQFGVRGPISIAEVRLSK